MTASSTPQLQRAVELVSMPGILVDHRLISDGDETALLPDELGAFAGSVIKVRRASGAARRVARGLLARLGQEQQTILKSESGQPVWPHGIVGSLAHDAEIAVAALARQSDFSSVGIDVEPAAALDPALSAIIATARERERIDDDPGHIRALFSIKEAVYKAAYPLDGLFLDHQDVEVDLATGTAAICNGRLVHFRYCISTHVVALAYVPAVGPRSMP